MKAARASLRAVPARRILDPVEKQEMAANWGTMVCRFGCGTAHLGLCPRVKRIRTSRLPNGAMTEDVEFWPNGRWSPPPHGFTAEDVGVAGVPMAAIEATASEQPTRKAGKK